MGVRTWTPERDAILIEAVIAGRPVREIAIELGVSESSASGQAYRLGLKQQSLLPSVRERIIELAVEGVTLGRISRQTGVPEAGVRFVLSRAGVTLRTPTHSYRGPDARRAGR